MKFIIYSIATLALIAGSICGQASSSEKTERQDSQAIVYVYSYKHIKTLGRVAPPVYLDDKVLAKLDGERFFVILLDPGVHSFHLKQKNRGGLEMEFKPGETYYVRMNMREGATVGPAGMVLMPKESGVFDIKQMKPIKKGDIKDSRVLDGLPPG